MREKDVGWLTGRAVMAADSDLEDIKRRIDQITDEDEPFVSLVDGRKYSPAWRALTGGWGVYRMTDGVMSMEVVDAVFEAYESTLDAGTEALGLYWDDGQLWYHRDIEGELHVPSDWE